MTLIWILVATFVVSIISFVGAVSLVINDSLLKKILVLMIGFAAGSLLGAAFFHLMPEALEKSTPQIAFIYLLSGFVVFLVMERYFHWRHCHEEVCDVHAFAYLNLMGDGIHNFTDGMIIAVTFITDIRLGIITTLAIIFHEVPQELGDFSVLIYGGLTKLRALFYNFLCALTAVLGALAGYLLTSKVTDFSSVLLPFSAGGFIYIAASDLVPELHKQKQKRANLSFLAFFIGIIFMWVTSNFIHEH